MTWLLDTNIVSEISKPAPNPNCMAWLEVRRGQWGISSITLAELRYGIELLPEGKRKASAEAEFRVRVEEFKDSVFDFDWPAATEWGRYAAELRGEYGGDWWKQFDLRDTQIAAIAREYGLTVATRNVKHFPFCPTVNPFSGKDVSKQ
jgi:toxin FitB